MKRFVLICSLFAGLNSMAQQRGIKTDQQLIDKLRADWSASLQNKQLQKAMDIYTDNAIFYSPGMKAAAGKKAISSLYQMVMKKYTSRCSLHSTGIAICGPMAYDSGSYNETLLNANTHKTISLKGDYLMALKKQAGGNWKITRIMWTEWK